PPFRSTRAADGAELTPQRVGPAVRGQVVDRIDQGDGLGVVLGAGGGAAAGAGGQALTPAPPHGQVAGPEAEAGPGEQAHQGVTAPGLVGAPEAGADVGHVGPLQQCSQTGHLGGQAGPLAAVDQGGDLAACPHQHGSTGDVLVLGGLTASAQDPVGDRCCLGALGGGFEDLGGAFAGSGPGVQLGDGDAAAG